MMTMMTMTLKWDELSDDDNVRWVTGFRHIWLCPTQDIDYDDDDGDGN